MAIDRSDKQDSAQDHEAAQQAARHPDGSPLGTRSVGRGVLDLNAKPEAPSEAPPGELDEAMYHDLLNRDGQEPADTMTDTDTASARIHDARELVAKAAELATPAEAAAKLDSAAAQIKRIPGLIDNVARLTDATQLQADELLAQLETIKLLRESFEEVHADAQRLREQLDRQEVIEQSKLAALEGSIVRVTITTLVCGVLTGIAAPALIFLTAKSLIGSKVIEGVAGGLIAATATELANRVADPTSHRHRG